MASSDRAARIEGALWGMFIADALSMPVHWYYSRKNIARDFEGGVRGYEAPKHPHPESFMVGMGYHPDTQMARRLGRPYDILGAHARFYETSYSSLDIDRGERETEHGNAVPAQQDRYHYHHGLRQGDLTLASQLVRVLLRTVTTGGAYDEKAFLDAFVEFMTTPDQDARRDPYTEIYLRRWFENYAAGTDPVLCAERQRRVWSIGSHGGMVRPLVLALLYSTEGYLATGMAIEHQNLTHRSENVAAALATTVPLLLALLDGADPGEAFESAAGTLHPPKVTGEELFRAYRDHSGPGNIPRDEMWHLHTDLAARPMDLETLVRDVDEDTAIRGLFATACYPEHGLPLAFYQARRHDFDLEAGLLANANAGGDNVHRGMVLGVLLGAAVGRVPARLKQGLRDYDDLKTEIEAFAAIAART